MKNKIDIENQRESFRKLINSFHFCNYPVIFIHGIAASFEDWKTAIDIVSDSSYYNMQSESDDFIVFNYNGKSTKKWFWNISYYTKKILDESINGNLTLYAERLEKMINIIKKLSGKKKVVLITHSMGGLVSKKFMTLSDENWNSVHKILTVGTPHEGVATSLDLIGQLKDLKKGSLFLKRLNKDWKFLYDKKKVKLGVIGGVDLKNKNEIIDSITTDSAGIGYVEISSSIPDGEWIKAVKYINNLTYDDSNFNLRSLVISNHTGLLKNNITLEAIKWAIKN